MPPLDESNETFGRGQRGSRGVPLSSGSAVGEGACITNDVDRSTSGQVACYASHTRTNGGPSSSTQGLEGAASAAARLREAAGVRDFVWARSPQADSFNGGNGGRAAVKLQKLDLERCRTWVGVHDGSNVASDESVRWHRPRQHHAFVLAWSAGRQGFTLVPQSASRSAPGWWTTCA